MTRNALHITLHISPTIPKLTYGRYTSDSCVKGSIIRQYYIGSNAKQGDETSNTLVYTSMRRDIMSPEATIIKGHHMLGAEQLYTKKQVQLGGKDTKKRGVGRDCFYTRRKMRMGGITRGQRTNGKRRRCVDPRERSYMEKVGRGRSATERSRLVLVVVGDSDGHTDDNTDNNDWMTRLAGRPDLGVQTGKYSRMITKAYHFQRRAFFALWIAVSNLVLACSTLRCVSSAPC